VNTKKRNVGSERDEKVKRITHPQIPRINQKSLLHILTNPHKLGKHTRVLTRLFLRDDKLHTGGVHPVSKGRDDG